MNARRLLGCISVLSLATLSTNAAEPPNTIKACAALLPQGHQFNASINIVMSTKTPELSFDGEFKLTDGSGASPATFSDAQARPFLECVVALLE